LFSKKKKKPSRCFTAKLASSHTGGIAKFSAQEIFRKILKVSHFSLGFSLDEKCDKIKTSHRFSPEFSYSYRVSLVFSGSVSKSSNKTL